MHLPALLIGCAVSCAVFSVRAHADEIRLKDGSKIIGTIVGYEDDSFRVQTAYGFALIRKNSVKEIVPTDGSRAADPTAAPSDATTTKSEAKPVDSAATKPQTKPAATSAPIAASVKPPMTAPAALPVITPVSATPAAMAATLRSCRRRPRRLLPHRLHQLW